VPKFEKWNYIDTEELAEIKKGTIVNKGDFIKEITEKFISYYQPLIL
jgi:predicted ATP-dependent protease